MPLEIKKLKEGMVSELEVWVPGEDEPVKVKYRPGAFTLEMHDKLKGVIASGFEAEAALITLEPVLIEWDLIGDDGNQLGVTAQDLKKVPLHFLTQVILEMEKDMRPDPTKSATSEDISAQTGEQEQSQTGTSPSEQRTGSLSL